MRGVGVSLPVLSAAGVQSIKEGSRAEGRRTTQWSWTTADVRHSRKTWLPTLEDEICQLLFSDLPTVLGAWALERWVYRHSSPSIGIDSLSYPMRGLLTLSQGVFLFATFSAGYTAGAIATSPLRHRYRQW